MRTYLPQLVIVAIVTVFVFLWWVKVGMGQFADQSLAGIRDKVAVDAEAQYRIAEEQGDKLQKCVQAGFVSAAYLQAQDQPQYNRWKAQEHLDCLEAGQN